MTIRLSFSLNESQLIELKPKPPEKNPYDFFWYLVTRHFKFRAFGLVALSIAGIGLMGFEPVLMKSMINALERRPLDTNSIWTYFGMIVGAWLLSSIANRLRDLLDIYTSPEIRKRAQLEIYCWLEGHSQKFFEDHMAGSLSQKVKQCGSAMVSLTSIIFDGFVRVVMAIVLAALILSTAPSHFFWLFVVWLIGFISLSVWFAKRCVPLFKEFGDQVSESTGTLVDVTSHMQTVRSSVKTIHERLNILAKLEKEKSASKKTRWFLIWMFGVLYSLLIFFQGAFIGLAVSSYISGEFGLGEVVMISSLAAILVSNVWGLSTQLLQYFEQIGTLKSALNLISKDHDIQEAPNAQELDVQKASVQFKNISYKLPSGQYLFKNFDLHIKQGEHVGFVGLSGAGKSTLTKLLQRQYDLDEGEILINNHNIAELKLASLNRAIAVVPQEPELFHRTLRENITYSHPNPSDGDFLRAATLSHCMSFIDTRPEGADILVGERGIKLSGGERQRVALARAFLKDAPILILDEATSALDSQTEAFIQESVAALCQGKTVLVIAHRLSTLLGLDRIIVLDAGKIVEQGTHHELISMNGLYSKLWNQQVFSNLK
jgi:ATP-binding cassette subfamily B protein